MVGGCCCRGIILWMRQKELKPPKTCVCFCSYLMDLFQGPEDIYCHIKQLYSEQSCQKAFLISITVRYSWPKPGSQPEFCSNGSGLVKCHMCCFPPDLLRLTNGSLPEPLQPPPVGPDCLSVALSRVQ